MARRRRSLSDVASTGGYKPKKPKPRKTSGQLVPSAKHPFDIVPPTRSQKIGRRVVTKQRQAEARQEQAKARARAIYRKHAAERDPANLRAAVSSAQLYPSRITRPPERHLSRKAQRFNRAVQEAGVGQGLKNVLRPAEQAAMALIQSPGGMYHLARHFGLDVNDLVHGRFQVPRVAHDIAGMGEQVGQDFAHPLRNLGFLALDVAGLGSAGAGTGLRTAAGLRALRAGEGVGKALRTASRRPVPPLTTERFRNLEVSSPLLDNPAVWPIQKLMRGKQSQGTSPKLVNEFIDLEGKVVRAEQRVERVRGGPGDPRAYGKDWKGFSRSRGYTESEIRDFERWLELNRRYPGLEPDSVVAGKARASPDAIREHLQGATSERVAARIGSRLTQEQRTRHDLERALPTSLIAAGKRATLPQQAALLSIAEGVHPLARAASEVKLARKASGAARLRHTKLARLYRAAEHYVDEVDGKLVISSTGRGRNLRDKLLRKGVSQKELQRLHGAAKASERRRTSTLIQSELLSPEAAAQRRASPATVVQTGEPFAGLVDTPFSSQYRVPSTPKRRGTYGAFRPTSGAVGFPKKEGALTHSYTGGARLKGLERQDTTRLVGESELTSLKYHRVMANRDRLLKAATKEKHNVDDVAVRTEALRGKTLPPEAKALFDKQEAGTRLTQAEKVALGKHWNSFIKKAFPDDIEPQKGIVWVPKKIADGIMPEAELVGRLSKHGGRLTTGVDALNTVMKMGLLTLKGPGYLLPNLLGQAFLGVAHQGVHLPRNMGALRSLKRELGPQDWERFKALGGSGISHVLEGKGRLDTRFQAWMVGLYETVLDTPWRASGALHEMHRRDVHTIDDIRAVLNHPDQEMVRQHVAHYAREAYIDFGRIGPFERQVVMRAFFLYPWLKGSARYTLRFLVEHPVQAAALAKLGQKQMERNQKELGALPSWLGESGTFKVGGGKNFPTVVNPQAASILGQFPQLLLEARRDPVGSIFQHLSPAADIGIAVGMKHSPFFGGPLYGTRPQILLDETLQQFPLFQLLHPDRTPAVDKTYYPGDRRKQAAGKMIFGGGYPRTLNRAYANAHAEAAKKPKSKTSGKKEHGWAWNRHHVPKKGGGWSWSK